MSSASELSYLAATDPEAPYAGPLVAPVRARLPAPFVGDPIWTEALRADAAATSLAAGALGALFEDLVGGRFAVLHEDRVGARTCLVGVEYARPAGARRALTDHEARVVARILSGDSQKVIAADLRMGASTVSRHYLKALYVLGLDGREVPLLLVLAAQSWAGLSEVPWARKSAFDYQCCRCVVLSVPAPAPPPSAGLTRSECDVAELLVAGVSPRDIARRRSISVHTALSHTHAVFRKLRVTGRYALVRAAVSAGWFRSVGSPEHDRGGP